MANRRYEFSTNNASASYTWTDGTPDSIRRLQNPATILGNHATAYYIYQYRLYKIQTYSGINATNRQSCTSVVEDCTIDEADAFTSIAYGEKLSVLNQYLLYFISGKSYFSSSKMNADTICTVLNYIMKHLPSAIANDTIIDSETMKFIRPPAGLEQLSVIENQLMLPDFSADSPYDKLYAFLVKFTEKQSAKYLLFISDIYIAGSEFSNNRNLLQDYYYYLSLIASKKEEEDALCHHVYAFVREKSDFCYKVIFHELYDYESFVKNMDVVKSYFPHEVIIKTLQVMLEKSLGSQKQGTAYVDLIIQSIDALIAHHRDLKLADKEQLIQINTELTEYIGHFSSRKKLSPPTPEQLTITEYFLMALKGNGLKVNLEQATYKEIDFIAEYCRTNEIEIDAIKNALKPDVQANTNFIEYYIRLYQKDGKHVKYTNDIPAELFVNGLLTLSEFRYCYGEKDFRKKWKEMDKKFVQQRYSKTNILSLKFLFKLWLSRRIYLWQDHERFLYLSEMSGHSDKKGKKS